MSLVDLRKIHIKTEAEAIEFLEVIESKMGQLKQVFKKSRMEKQSLTNRVRFEREQAAKGIVQQPAPNVDPSASVSQVVSGTAPTKADDRLAQLRAVQTEPGEIGQLQVPVEQTKVPKKEDNIVDPATEVEQGSVKEPENESNENEVQQEKVEKEDVKEVEPIEVPDGPSEADKTPVGAVIARKTKGKVEAKLKKNK